MAGAMSWSSSLRTARVALKRLAYGGRSRAERDRVVTWLGLQAGMRVADVGAGFGEFVFDFARAVGPAGVVYAVDTDADLRAEVADGARRLGLPRVRVIQARSGDPGLPEPVDLVFLSASFHHLPDREPYFVRLRDGLHPGGRVAILESVPGSGLRVPGHATEPAAIRHTMEAAGYRLLASSDIIRGASLQTFVVAGRPGQASG
jgi:ubiquinone/menaquinone biosynthesis C-methylase UbiE